MGKSFTSSEMPLYGIAEAARYLDVPPTTLRYWVRGRSPHYKPVLNLPDPQLHLMSFINLIEAHVLNAIRRNYPIGLLKIRRSLGYIEHRLTLHHPLANDILNTDGIDLFVDYLGDTINVSRSGQLGLRQIMETYLQRIKYDPTGLAKKLYPFSRTDSNDPRLIVIDPTICFGKPMVRGILTSILAERYKAGESMPYLSKDYDLKSKEVEEAIRYELSTAA